MKKPGRIQNYKDLVQYQYSDFSTRFIINSIKYYHLLSNIVIFQEKSDPSLIQNSCQLYCQYLKTDFNHNKYFSVK